MFVEEVAEVLSQAAVAYRNSPEAKTFLRSRGECRIEPDVASLIITPVLALLAPHLPPDVIKNLRDRRDAWKDGALESIRRNSHMNRAHGAEKLFQETFDALLVDYVNYSLRPLDYGMYTYDLER